MLRKGVAFMNSWKSNAVFYQIYPTSFYDGNGDGIGDFVGMIEKLDYVKSLGVDAVWLNPFYLSPFMDGGYDVEDYYQVDPRFGTMQDFENFVAKAKSLGIRVVVDLVIGHTSFKNKWFIESGKNERNEKSDWYIWTSSHAERYPDKTIVGLFERDGAYFINYYACQPALNYGWIFEKEEKRGDWQMHYTDERLVPLREEIIKVMQFWMSKGIDGFRVDMASHLVKGGEFETEDPKLFAGIKWLWEKLMAPIKAQYPEVFFVAEWDNPVTSVGECGFDSDFILHDIPCYNDLFRNEPGSNLYRFFEKGHSYFSKEGKGSLKEFIKYSQHVYDKVDGKGSYTVPSGNHDQVRLAHNRDDAMLKTVFAFLLTHKHIPFIYYGDEIGIKHNFSVNKDGGFIRTGSRTPMQWTNGKNRGFSTFDGELYLPVNSDENQSVESQEKDENSLLNTVRELIAIRKEYSCLNAEGDFIVIEDGYPFIYERKDQNGSVIVLINPSDNNYQREIAYSKVIKAVNAQLDGESVTLGAQSFAILKK